jgi:3-hydroxyisobutyrate dehydrogenase
MGSGMARRLIGAGFPVTVFNRNPEKSAAFEDSGARIARSAREAAGGAEVVHSMLADDNAARATWLGETGALAGAEKGTVLIESSTVSVAWIKELGAAADSVGCTLLDAPVTGTKPHAANGELSFIVGGPEAALKVATPMLQVMGKSITHLGPLGSGALMKLINNFVCAVQAASLAEALAWIERAGLDREKALPIMSNGAPGSPLFKTLAARMTAEDFTPNFALRLLAKDVSYAMNEAAGASINLVTAPAALELLNRAIAAGFGDVDMSAVVEPLRKK